MEVAAAILVALRLLRLKMALKRNHLEGNAAHCKPMSVFIELSCVGLVRRHLHQRQKGNTA